VEVEEVASTLPIDYFLRILEPAPSPNILTAAENLSYRALVLVALFLNRPSVTPYATIYSPEAGFPQTRAYEPRNRSLSMSPQGRTSLVAEIPCQEEDGLWSLGDASLIEMIASRLTRAKWIAEEDVMDASVIRLDHAYPILDLGFEKYVRVIMDYLDGFANLRLSGRNAKFVYGWIHNMLKAGQEIVRDYTEGRPSP
jgi:protoporphyrinogen oxidase